MRSTESKQPQSTPTRRTCLTTLAAATGTASLAGLPLLAGCASRRPDPDETSTPIAKAGQSSIGPAEPVPARSSTPSHAVKLPPPNAVRNMQEVRRQAALRLMAANPHLTYAGVPPEPLLAIPVLEVELNADGTIRRIDVMRHPSQARDTTDIAKEAIRAAAPFGDVSRLPKPWRFTETFLFDDDRKFKPRTLD